jgi:hypothetical protein
MVLTSKNTFDFINIIYRDKGIKMVDGFWKPQLHFLAKTNSISYFVEPKRCKLIPAAGK